MAARKAAPMQLNAERCRSNTDDANNPVRDCPRGSTGIHLYALLTAAVRLGEIGYSAISTISQIMQYGDAI